MNPNYLLTEPLAQELYHRHAAGLPIIDYHNHLSASQIREDLPFGGITELWITADPYKHRAMRILGVAEHFITGSASPEEKFRVWYESLPRLIGNPLFDWSAMELSLLGLELLPLLPWKEAYHRLDAAVRQLRPSTLLEKFSILYSAPCTALTDELAPFDGKHLAPSLRGDDLLLPDGKLLEKLEALTGRKAGTLDAYLEAVAARLADFRKAGCRFADHALDNGFRYLPEDGKNEGRFAALAAGEALNAQDSALLRSRILRELLVLYAGADFTVQLHMGAQRSTSTRLKLAAGAAGGYAAMGSGVDIASITNLLDAAEQAGGLPRIMIFPLNPADNAAIATLSGSFSRDGQEALVSQGPAWWWCDHYQGIFDMLDHFCCHSILSTFVGMTTDSRSFLSFVRHDYFRRCLCQWMAEQVNRGRLPNDIQILADTLKRICFENANKRIGG